MIRVGRVGGGFDPTPNGSLVTPRRIMPPMNGRPSPRNLPGLQVSKAPAMGPGIPPPPPPPPYSQEQSFHGQTPGMLFVTFGICQFKKTFTVSFDIAIKCCRFFLDSEYASSRRGKYEPGGIAACPTGQQWSQYFYVFYCGYLCNNEYDDTFTSSHNASY